MGDGGAGTELCHFDGADNHVSIRQQAASVEAAMEAAEAAANGTVGATDNCMLWKNRTCSLPVPYSPVNSN